MSRQRVEGKLVVIVDAGGRLVGVASMNSKAFTKSTERGELWVVHDETGRVLPYGDGLAVLRVEEKDRWYRATVKTGEGEATGSEKLDEPDRQKSAAAPSPVGSGKAKGAETVLRDLCEVIQRRRAERPEGSYTTYLFEAGEEKIRKKTGEEAIELVLARTRNEIVAESADLIYHLLVLLNQLEIPVDEVIDELARRE